MAANEDAEGQHEADQALWPPRGDLADAWEANGQARQAMRLGDALLVWPDDKLVGLANMKTLGLNKFVIYEALRAWCEWSSDSKSPPIGWLKQEAT